MFSRHKDHTKMGSVRELQSALSEKENEAKIKDNRIHVLEAELRRKDEQIRKLESELDKYRSVLQPTAAKTPKSRLPRLGISAEPTVAKNLEEKKTAPLRRHSKSLRSKDLIKEAILDNDFLKNLEPSQIREVVDCMYETKYKKDQVIIQEGDTGSHLYVLEDGKCVVTKEGQVLGNMGPGKAFGELAILYNCTRTATVKASTNASLWVIDRQTFQTIMMKTGLMRQAEHMEFLKSVPLLKELGEDALLKIADVIDEQHYDEGEYVIRQGARGETFFIIKKGTIVVTKRQNVHDEPTMIREMTTGEYFGEKALKGDDFRTANCIAGKGGTHCLVLDREAYCQFINGLQFKDYEDQQATTDAAKAE